MLYGMIKLHECLFLHTAR